MGGTVGWNSRVTAMRPRPEGLPWNGSWALPPAPPQAKMAFLLVSSNPFDFRPPLQTIKTGIRSNPNVIGTRQGQNPRAERRP
jgi:hypothetical protein